MDATPEPMIRLDGVSKKYDDGTVAVHDLDLDVPEGETVVLVGPSGCGKSTTLKMVNRLIEPTSGRILLEGEDVTHVDPVKLRRRMGYVIQQTGLFPHQTIAANVATVPEAARLGPQEGRRPGATSCSSWSAWTRRRYAKRYPHQLSGGQRQRVGVARALAADPPVLLMDEPFGAVDPIVRERLQGEFIRLQREVRKTVLFVTHDLDEAVRMGDRIAVFSEGGHLEQYDAPDPAARLAGHRLRRRASSAPTAASSGSRSPPSSRPTSSTRRSCTSTDRVADATASLRAAGRAVGRRARRRGRPARLDRPPTRPATAPSPTGPAGWRPGCRSGPT